jgi:hypothetical protein
MMLDLGLVARRCVKASKMENFRNTRQGQSDTPAAESRDPEPAQNSGTLSAGLSSPSDQARSASQDITKAAEDAQSTAGPSGLSLASDQARFGIVFQTRPLKFNLSSLIDIAKGHLLHLFC